MLQAAADIVLRRLCYCRNHPGDNWRRIDRRRGHMGMTGTGDEWEGVRMPREDRFDPPIYPYQLGSVAAEVYFVCGRYRLFIVGERLASYLGQEKSLEACKQNIKSLELLIGSDKFKLEVERYRRLQQGDPVRDVNH